MADKSTLLQVDGISKSFGATKALSSVRLSAYAGEVHAVVGENGSGKSTLMRIVAGAYQPDEGAMLLDGQVYEPKSPADARRRGVAMIHQELSLCPHLSVLDNVLLGDETSRGGFLDLGAETRRVKNALAPLGLADLDINRPVKSYPIGVQQLIEIGRALATEAKVVVLDEPTSSLTEADVRKLFEVIKLLKDRGCAVLFISHFLNEIREICDRMTILRDGKFIEERMVEGSTDAQIVSLMVGRDVDDLYPKSERSVGETLLSIDHLAGRKLPISASLEVRRGEVVGIAGLNGAGRSELLRVIFGLDPVKAGTIKVAGYVGPASPAQRWQEQVGMLSEDRKLEGLAIGLSISENIQLPSLHTTFISPRKLDRESEEWIEKLSIKAKGPKQAVGALSGGNQQKVALGRILHHGADLLLLDEPTRGIDVGSKAQIYKLIDQAAKSGKGVLMVSSYLPELIGVCDRIAVMRRGQLGPAHPVESVTQESLLHEAVLG